MTKSGLTLQEALIEIRNHGQMFHPEMRGYVFVHHKTGAIMIEYGWTSMWSVQKWNPTWEDLTRKDWEVSL